MTTHKTVESRIYDIVEEIKGGKLKSEDAKDLLLSLYYGDDSSKCSRCGSYLTDIWDQSFAKFKLDIDVNCQSTYKLWGSNHNLGFRHPAIDKENSSMQKLIISSGKNENYRLCFNCHEKFIRMVGDFLRGTKFDNNGDRAKGRTSS